MKRKMIFFVCGARDTYSDAVETLAAALENCAVPSGGIDFHLWYDAAVDRWRYTLESFNRITPALPGPGDN